MLSRVDSGTGFETFFEYVLQHLLVEAQVGHELFKMLIFLFQLLESAQFGHAQTALLFFQLY